MMRLLPIALILSLMLAVAAPAAVAKTRGVKIGDNYFVRKGSHPTITVKKGTTVRWNWSGHNPHNVVGSGPASFNSGVKSHGGHYAKKLKKAGTYTIICSIHAGMKMKVKVKK
jgi:plastocyanin